MAESRQPVFHKRDSLPQRLFACAFGVLLGLGLLKFANPALVADHVTTPVNVFEWVLTAWPLEVGQVLLVVLGLSAVFVVRKRPDVPRWLVFAPLPWLAWQFIAATGSVQPDLTVRTLIHFVTNVGCFYLGLFCLSPIRNLRGFWAGLMTCFALVLLTGWQQRFGGLEATREMFFEEIYPAMNGNVPEAMMKRMASDRIFATLFYPNTLAGVVLLLVPVSIGVCPVLFRHESAQRIGLMLMLVLAGGCLVWSGSKAGWLLMLGLALVALFHLNFSRTLKVGLAILVVAAGSGGFVWKYSGYLQKGAQSAVARVDYWEAALKITAANPVRGSGPGTFGKAYAAVKRPESEMAHLTHNDYLQQASDSGIPGFVFFAGFIVPTMIHLWRRVWKSSNPLLFWVWLGLLGITAQSLTEFGLYIPATSWLMLALMGWLVGSVTNDLDNLKSPKLSSDRI